MKILRVNIENFRTLTAIEMNDLGDTVVLVGENGAGKTTVLDAIRLLKVAIAEQAPNELQQLLAEFHITGTPLPLRNLQRDQSKTTSIQVHFSLSEADKQGLRNCLPDLLHSRAFDQAGVGAPAPGRPGITPRSLRDARLHSRTLDEARVKVEEELSRDSLVGDFRLEAGESAPAITAPLSLELLFSTWSPGTLPAMIFHSAHRTYNRETPNAIQLAPQDNLRVHALSSNQAKYAGIKSELISIRGRELLRAASETPGRAASNIEENVHALFETFFAPKQFGGITFDAADRPRLDVVLPDGTRHDLDDLSAGEREVLFGYLRVYAMGLSNSILLFDEPELHMHPRMAGRLVRFLRDTIVAPRDNQLIAASHSDHVLRDALTQEHGSVFLIKRPGSTANQAVKVSASEGHLVLSELVGEFAHVVQGLPIVIFEGEGAEFDRWLTGTWFPEFATSHTLLSAGSKQSVVAFRAQLNKLLQELGIRVPVYSVVDRDFDAGVQTQERFQWDVYHVENYLLDDSVIESLMKARQGPRYVPINVGEALRECARSLVDQLVAKAVQRYVNSELRNAITTKPADAATLSSRVFEIARDISNMPSETLSLVRLRIVEKQEKARLEATLANDEWRRVFPGRELLRAFIAAKVPGQDYEEFRNQIADLMRRSGPPEAMARILARIRDARQGSASAEP